MNQALMKAVRHYDIEGCRKALEAGADVNSEAEEMSALYRAAGNGCVAIVELLIEKGADVNLGLGSKLLHETPLMNAIQRHQFDKKPEKSKIEIDWAKVVDRLLSCDAIQLQVEPNPEKNILFWAIKKSGLNHDVARVLVHSPKLKMSDVDAEGNTALMLTASRSYQCVDLDVFLEKIDIAIKNKNDKNVIDIVLELQAMPKIIMDRIISLLVFVTKNEKYNTNDEFNAIISSFLKDLDEGRTNIIRNALQTLKGEEALRTNMKNRFYKYIETTVNEYLEGNKNNEVLVKRVFDLYQQKRKTPLFEILRMGDRGKIDYYTGTWDKFSKLMKRVQAADVKVSKAGMHGEQKSDLAPNGPSPSMTKPGKK